MCRSLHPANARDFSSAERSPELRDPAVQKKGQIDIMQRQDKGSKQRTDAAYPLGVHHLCPTNHGCLHVRTRMLGYIRKRLQIP